MLKKSKNKELKNSDLAKGIYSFRLNNKTMDKVKLYAALNDTNSTKILKDAINYYPPLKKHLKLIK